MGRRFSSYSQKGKYMKYQLIIQVPLAFAATNSLGSITHSSPASRQHFYMMTSSNGNIFRVTGPLCGEFTGPGEFPTQRPVTWSFDVFFDLRLNKRLSKQQWGWWFETPSWSLWRQCNVFAVVWLGLWWLACCDNQLDKQAIDVRLAVIPAKLLYILILGLCLKASLTYWGWDKMAAIFQTTFSNAFSWLKFINFD